MIVLVFKMNWTSNLKKKEIVFIVSYLLTSQTNILNANIYNFICLLNILKLIKNKECLLQIFVLNVYKSLNDYFSEAFSARMLRK